jgi:hypothetical protein
LNSFYGNNKIFSHFLHHQTMTKHSTNRSPNRRQVIQAGIAGIVGVTAVGFNSQTTAQQPEPGSFCPNCGSRLFGKRALSDLLSITAASLDDSSWFRPAMDCYTASAQPWDYINPDLPKFAKFPPSNTGTQS